MFNKISSFNIRSEKNDHWNDVFVAQPDALKENLAGKVFLLAEFFGKKNQGERVFNFIVESIEETYYNDEKLLLKEKVEGLKTENIFEAALATTNLALASWLEKEKINISFTNCNLTLGVVFENHIHFSNFGRNKALLLYQQKDNYETINVETNAFEKEETGKKTNPATKDLKVFSSVISGEVPKNSFFVFSSESLPEYISEKELSLIVSKLPPLTAAYQIKNLLEKINIRIPFFGIIIKSASELDKYEYQEELMQPLSAHNSISSLKNIERKTEELLTSSSLINISKISKRFTDFIRPMRVKSNKETKVISHLNYGRDNAKVEEMQVSVSDELEKKIEAEEKERINTKEKLNQNFGIIRTLGAVKKDSNIKDEKFSFKKRGDNLFSQTKINSLFSNVFGLFKNFEGKNNLKKKLIIIVIPLLIIVLITSISITKRNREINDLKTKLDEVSLEIKSKENLIDSKLLYDDRDSAFNLLQEIKQTISNLTLNKHSQSGIALLEKRAKDIEDKVSLVKRLSGAEKIYDFSQDGVNHLITVGSDLYSFTNNSIFKLDGSDNPKKIAVDEDINNYHPVFYDNKIYLFNNKNIISFDPANDKINKKAVSGYEDENGITSFSVYSGEKLYLLRASLNKIDNLSSPYNDKLTWLKEDADLKNTQDLYIDGNVYLLENSGSVSKYRSGKKQDYTSTQLNSDIGAFTRILAYKDKLYLFNAEAKKIVVLNKESGLLLSQYIFEDLSEIQDFAIDEVAGIVYVISQKQVFKYPL